MTISVSDLLRAALIAGLVLLVLRCWIWVVTALVAAWERDLDDENVRALRRSGWKG